MGVEVVFRPAGKHASSRFARKASASIKTHVRLLRVGDGWRLIEAERDRCFVNQPEFKNLSVKVAAHDDIVRNATHGVSVQRGKDGNQT